MKTIIKGITGSLLSASMILTTGCGITVQNKGAEKGIVDSLAQIAGMVAKPKDPASEKARLQRFRGQTEFLNPYQSYSHRGGAPEASAQQDKAAAGGGARSEQESDIFKIGKPGSKLVYLLNNYRGLQVVSFEDGAESPKLLGRVKATGNYPSDMYYDESHDRLLVVEKYSFGGDWSESRSSRLLSYDVSNPAAPKIAGSVDLKGFMADSRIVGDVLYVATTNEKKGVITSYSLKSSGLKEIDSYQLPQPVSQQNTMNIVTTQKEGVTNYYLIATMSESEWGWWDRQNSVQVVDITDPKGDIKLVMSVAAKGFLHERTQTTIKNDTLIVTSNYFIDKDSRIGRIAVETFRFPQTDSEVIAEKEAQYRKLHIDRELGDLSGEEREAKLNELMLDANLGLKGRFVREEGNLRKLVPDSSVTVGDGSGLSANLQDVRYADGYLYAFWVPANQMDPFDLFDIRNPEQGVKYVGRLQFDGWIERAIPLTYKGRNFVLGLGRVVSVVNNETQRRRPQAMIFELIKRGSKMQAIEVAQYTFEGSDIWTNYNDEDKTIEVREGANGQGEVLFPAAKYSSKEMSDGGQILKFDLENVVQEKEEGALKPGAFLAGGAGWVRRIFTNSEINRINSFTDLSLAVFGADKTSADILKPVAVLELARNLQAYEVVKAGQRTFGVQFVGNGQYYESSTTSLRVVLDDKADTEKTGVLSETTLKGSYLGHIVDQKSGDLVVLTNEYSRKGQGHDYSYSHKVIATRVVFAPGGRPTATQVEWDIESQQQRNRFSMDYSTSLIQLQDGTVLAQADSEIKVLDLTKGISFKNFELANCATENRQNVEVQVIAGRPFLSSKELLESKDYKGLEFTRNYIASLEVNGAKATCAAEVNIPGRAVMMTKTGEILTEDDSVQDIVQSNVDDRVKQIDPTFRYLSKASLASLKIADGKAVLKEQAQLSENSSTRNVLGDRTFVQIKKDSEYSEAYLEFLELDNEGYITTDVRGLQLDGDDKNVSLTTVVSSPMEDQFIGLVQSEKSVQVIAWNKESRAVRNMMITPTNERMEKQKPVKVLPIRGLGWSYYGNSYRPHFNQSLMSFEIPMGLTGVEQFYLAE